MTPYGNMAFRPVAWEIHIHFHELKKISRNCVILDDPRKQKETSWTERAGYEGRESFSGALMPHRADTQHPPLPPTNLPVLGQGSPNPTPPLSMSAWFLLRIPSRRPLLSPCCSCQAPSPGSLVLAPAVVSLLHKREGTHFSDCLPQCLSLDTLLAVCYPWSTAMLLFKDSSTVEV